MKTGLKKSQKTTEIFFDEASPWITVNTYNTDLKNRLIKSKRAAEDFCRPLALFVYKIEVQKITIENFWQRSTKFSIDGITLKIKRDCYFEAFPLISWHLSQILAAMQAAQGIFFLNFADM